jgi:hypothetical protein
MRRLIAGLMRLFARNQLHVVGGDATARPMKDKARNSYYDPKQFRR